MVNVCMRHMHYTCVCVRVCGFVHWCAIHLFEYIDHSCICFVVLLFAIRFLPFFHPYLKCSIATSDSLRFFIIICHFYIYISCIWLQRCIPHSICLAFFFPLTFLIHLVFVFWLGYSVTVFMVWWKRKTSFGHTKRFKR